MPTAKIEKEVPIIPDGDEVNKADKVKELHKEGKTLEEIQAEVNMPAGVIIQLTK